jgi:hypothetical protein
MLHIQHHKDYGASSIKDSGQTRLLNEVEEDFFVVENEEPEIIFSAHTRKNKCVSISEELPREDITDELGDAEKDCRLDGVYLKLVCEEISEQLDIMLVTIKFLCQHR